MSTFNILIHTASRTLQSEIINFTDKYIILKVVVADCNVFMEPLKHTHCPGRVLIDHYPPDEGARPPGI